MIRQNMGPDSFRKRTGRSNEGRKLSEVERQNNRNYNRIPIISDLADMLSGGGGQPDMQTKTQQNLPDWRTEEAEGYDSVFSASNGKEYPFELKMSFCFERDIRGKKKKNKGWTGNGCSEKVGCYLLIQCSLDEYLPLNKKDGILIKDLWFGFVPIDGVKSKRGKGKSDRTSLNILSCSEIITEGSVHTTNTYLYPKF